VKRAPLERRTPLARTGPPRRTKARQRLGPISPASPGQRAKIRNATHCLACGQERSEYRTLDPAHLVPRGSGGCSDPDCVVPLCRTIDGGCHRAFDDTRTLDLLKVIQDRWPAEVREVAHMLAHVGPVGLVQRLANDRIRWEGSGQRG
jgi:hypothetical protein